MVRVAPFLTHGVVVLSIGFNPTRSTSPCYNPMHAYSNTYTKMNR